jgi:hypothetical protein
MNAREQARFDMIQRVGTFGTNNASDFTAPVPPAKKITPGQAQATQLFEDLNTPDTGLIARIGKNAENQQSGSGGAKGGATSKAVLRHALFLELKGFNRTAAAIAAAQDKPEIMEKFRMPYGVGDAVLVAKARAIADAAEPMAIDFVAYEHESTFADDLRAHVTAFGEADVAKDTGMQTQAGATEGFEPLLDEAMTKVHQLDAFMHNFYKTNAAKMGEWHTASHVERQKKKKDDAPPATAKP